MNPKTENEVMAALRRIVREAFSPNKLRHRRRGFAGSPCDVTCQACAIEQAKLALEKYEKDLTPNIERLESVAQ